MAKRQLQNNNCKTAIAKRGLQHDNCNTTIAKRQLQSDNCNTTIAKWQLQNDYCKTARKTTIVNWQLQNDSRKTTIAKRYSQNENCKTWSAETSFETLRGPPRAAKTKTVRKCTWHRFSRNPPRAPNGIAWKPLRTLIGCAYHSGKSNCFLDLATEIVKKRFILSIGQRNMQI